jgi:acetylornithine deacetylase/succinyl-diaminopimelate desuccinylase-like protein
VAVALAALLTGACTGPDAATAGQPDAQKVAAAITEEGLRARLEELAQAMEGSERFRSVGSAGYGGAAAVVERELAAAGWSVESDTYDDVTFVDDGGSSLEVGPQVFGDQDLRPLIFAPAGDAAGPVVVIGANASESTGTGCRTGDYGALPADAIVLVGPGDCLRRDQVIAAQQAGAAAFLAVAPEVPPGIVLRPTLLDPRGLAIPAAAASHEAAKALVAAATDGLTAHLVTNAHTERAPTRTVLAELRGVRDEQVVMLGAHLDSVIDGPGVNDNGSGVAALLEIARALSGTRPSATIRLAFWSGEELGLHGSLRYVEALSQRQRDAILVYANVDMIASPNGFAGVYDEPTAPVGSSDASRMLRAAVTRNGGTAVPVDLHNGSDHYGFVEAGVATTGVFSGALDPVSVEQAEASGAETGRPADACYHQPCDDLTNIDLGLARVLAAGLADFTVEAANHPELLAN